MKNLFILFLLFFCSCASVNYSPDVGGYPRPPKPDAGPIAIDEFFALFFKQNVEHILNDPEIGLSVVRADSQKITTEPVEYVGMEKGVLWWKKNYQERTSYTIVATGWEEKAIEIYAHTQHRPNENYPWETTWTEEGLKRTRTLLQAIVEKIPTVPVLRLKPSQPTKGATQ
jgi:hypothetical protein